MTLNDNISERGIIFNNSDDDEDYDNNFGKTSSGVFLSGLDTVDPQYTEDDVLIRDASEDSAKTALEKTVLLDESEEGNVLKALDEEDEAENRALNFDGSSNFYSTRHRMTGLSPFKRLSFGTMPSHEVSEGTKRQKYPIARPGRINLADLCDPLLPPKEKTVQDEFFGVYCLVSKSELRNYKNRCYIGFTVDPNRRIRQHNAGQKFGGAKKTDSRGPWDMVCIIHGFPNAISALRFEWAWQNPKRSKRLKTVGLRKERKESPFAFCFRICCQMLNSWPWCELALTFRWLIHEYEIPFPSNLTLPAHMKVAHGKVQKVNVVVPELRDYTTIRNCHICNVRIERIEHLLRCPATEICGANFHTRCLAENCLEAQVLTQQRLTPVSGNCPKCAVDFLWGDLVRDQRTLLLLEDAKPVMDGQKIAGGMIPKKIIKN